MGVLDRLRALAARVSGVTTPEELIARQRGVTGGRVLVTNDTAMRHSAVWACVRLRADLVSTMPLDTYRRRPDKVQIEVPKPPVLVAPGGPDVRSVEWRYSSQVDLDRAGNAFGIITERSEAKGSDGRGLPARVDLVALADVTVRAKGAVITSYLIGGQEYEPWEVWHEKQYTVAGLPVGLSPVAYAAWSIEESLGAQQFARDWFGSGAIPAAALKNTAKKINKDEAKIAKDAFKAAVKTGDLFVHGNDWEFRPIQSVASASAFLEAREFGLAEIARFFGVPADLIDAAVASGSITYANIGQRNLQFLIMNLDPVLTRREDAFTHRLLAAPRYVKFNRSALLAMDPETRARTNKVRIDSRTMTPNEARALEDVPPLTDAQLTEFDRLFGSPRTQPTTASAGGPNE